MPFSPIPVLVRHFDQQVLSGPAADTDLYVALADFLDRLPDPRRRQGRRYRLGSLLVLCAAAVLAGAVTLAAITRFAAGLDPDLQRRLGLTHGVPRSCTLGRLLARLDGDALDTALGTWMNLQLSDDNPAPAGGAGPPPRAVDGKALRGSRTATTAAVHLVAALVHGERTVLAQRQGSPPRATKSPPSAPCSSPSTSGTQWSPSTRSTPSTATPASSSRRRTRTTWPW